MLVHVCIDGFHEAWLHFRRARVGSVFSTAVLKIQASKPAHSEEKGSGPNPWASRSTEAL